MVAAPTPVPGSPQRGQQLIINYGCGSCHTIPGIPGADTDVGPSLAGFGERRYIAGVLVNNPENLRQWILNPHEIQPGTSMPNVGVTETDVQDITAYLYTLQ
jgi:cytochrome c